MDEHLLHISSNNSIIEVEFVYDSKTVLFSRPCKDSVKQFLQRCEIKLSSPQKKKKKNFSGDSFSDVPGVTCIFLSSDLIKLNNDLLLEKVLLDDSNKFQINDIVYSLVINLPKVVSATVSSHAMATYLIQPTVETKFSSHFECKWFVETEPRSYTEVREGNVYEPPVHFVNKNFKIEITPFQEERRGKTVTVLSQAPIQAPVGETPLTVRQQLTMMTSRNIKSDFRVVSYNVLADCYVFTEWAMRNMYPQCPKYILPMEYRKQILYREFTDYSADILALQEVEEKFFQNELLPFFETVGMTGVYSTLNARRSDGEALIYNKNLFDLRESKTLSMNESCYDSEVLTIFLRICSHDLREDFLCRTTTFQYCLLEMKKRSKYVLVVNSHLAAKHNFDVVRLLQTATAAHFVKCKSEQICADLNISKSNLAIFLLGDLNSSPDAFATRYMHKEVLDIEELDPMSAGTQFTLQLPEDLVSMESCYPRWSIEFTNMVFNFTSTLDWIYYNRDVLECVNKLPMPSLESVASYGGLPNVGMASDHLALVADFAFIT